MRGRGRLCCPGVRRLSDRLESGQGYRARQVPLGFHAISMYVPYSIYKYVCMYDRSMLLRGFDRDVVSSIHNFMVSHGTVIVEVCMYVCTYNGMYVYLSSSTSTI